MGVDGPYAPDEVEHIMTVVDLGVCSQSGGKTATVAVTEVKRNSGRPFAICIGGMTEAVVDGVGECHFAAGDAALLAAVLVGWQPCHPLLWTWIKPR